MYRQERKKGYQKYPRRQIWCQYGVLQPSGQPGREREREIRYREREREIDKIQRQGEKDKKDNKRKREKERKLFGNKRKD